MTGYEYTDGSVSMNTSRSTISNWLYYRHKWNCGH